MKKWKTCSTSAATESQRRSCVQCVCVLCAHTLVWFIESSFFDFVVDMSFKLANQSALVNGRGRGRHSNPYITCIQSINYVCISHNESKTQNYTEFWLIHLQITLKNGKISKSKIFGDFNTKKRVDSIEVPEWHY